MKSPLTFNLSHIGNYWIQGVGEGLVVVSNHGIIEKTPRILPGS